MRELSNNFIVLYCLLHIIELFILNCPILKEEAIQERLQIHDATERILNIISYHNFDLMLINIII